MSLAAATRVLLVGVSDYTDPAISDPAGAANDVNELKATLADRFGIAGGQVRSLLGPAATRAAVLDALSNWLLNDVAAGDELLFYYSGHGSNRRDDGGDETDDGLDEVLCPADYVQATGENGIVDDELGELLAKAAAGHLLVIIDACHSGTATKSVDGRLVDLGLARAGRTQARYLPPPSSGGTKSIDSRRWNAKGMTVARDIASPTLSACRDFQRAVSTKFMIGGKLVDHGAFTFMLLQGLSGVADGDGDGAMTLGEIDSFVDRGLRESAYQFEQQPELLVRSGEEQRAFMGTQLRKRPVELTRLENDRYRMNLGALDGVLPGGRMRIAVDDRGIKPQLAVLESADAHAAVVRLEEKPPSELERRFESGGAVEVAVAPESLPAAEIVLRVWVGSFFEKGRESMPPKSIIEALRRVERVRIVGDEGVADRLVVGEYSGSRLRIAVAHRSERIVRVIEGTEAEVASELSCAIETERLKYVLACMQDPGGVTRVKMRTVDGRSEYAVRRDGEKDKLELEIDVPSDGFLTVFDVDSQGGFFRLFPNEYHPEARVSAGLLRLPPPGQFVMPIIPPAGRDMIKVIWSRTPLPETDVATKAIGHGMVQIESAAGAVDMLAKLQQGLAAISGSKGFVPEAAPAGSFGADLGWSCDTIYIDTFDTE